MEGPDGLGVAGPAGDVVVVVGIGEQGSLHSVSCHLSHQLPHHYLHEETVLEE